jgi:uncharacterized protein Yka (UPF0111/DUF47 family)
MSRMHSNFSRQYKHIRRAIDQNFDLIKQLVEQANGLTQIIESLSEQGDSIDPKIKTNLENQVQLLNKAINELIKQTGDLFVEYDDFAKKVLTNG